ncbi:archaemetzincin-2-like [Ruditapes philippinarum]|uniref:archaemetzincin-2-like n=1 Tax=Ruditapes philippinarum TaxID=129788 RepID=UPI00295BD422|nr:archaemetzincin-2-like [Ruditapes philippinarum]
MGSAFSLPHTHRLLIGDLSTLPEQEQKLFNLSKYVLDLKNEKIGTVSPDLSIKIVALDEKKSDEIEQKKCAESHVTINSVDVSCNAIDLETSDNENLNDVISLFYLLVTNKPYYFSQTFSQWKSFTDFSILLPLMCCQGEKRKIYIQPVDSFPSFITEAEFNINSYGGSFDFFGLLKAMMDIYFEGMTVNLLPNIDVMQSKWKIKSRLHHKTQKKQYFVQDFYKSLQKSMPSDGRCIMGISWTDLYPTEKLNFVLGEANYGTMSGIFCFGRYEPKFYDPDTHRDITEINGKLMWRILKVLTHETCHLFGLQHCWYFQCAMNESNSMQEAASQPIFLCPVCLRKLQHTCGFDVLSRYKKMLPFLRDISEIYPIPEFLHSVKWLKKCIEFIESSANVT